MTKPGGHRHPRRDRQWCCGAHRDACRDIGLKHARTRPNVPNTERKSERLIQAVRG
ncbi:hypothetical protein [Mesorhizobium sp. ANAO-SY3R2]|uniref:hypothetical protein n=1 Tax=Mesorhizobium sp. ANAO-SY3R2 TaxID=3166644 RepID=UPI003672D152